jgi:hypothetical protein
MYVYVLLGCELYTHDHFKDVYETLVGAMQAAELDWHENNPQWEPLSWSYYVNVWHGGNYHQVYYRIRKRELED